jgi:hypothetical protein
MHGVWIVNGVIALTLIGTTVCEATAQTLTSYLESSGTEYRLRSNLGMSLRGDRLQMRADLALRGNAGAAGPTQRSPSGRTEVVPNLRSAFAVAKNLNLETRFSLAEWNSRADATLDARLRYRKALNSFVDELDGSIWRSPDGQMKQTLRLGFNQPLGEAGPVAPVTISGAAIFEASQQDRALEGLHADPRKVGVETRFSGLMPRYALFDQSVTVKLEKSMGRRSHSASTLAYEQAWTVRSLTKLGFSLKFLRRTDGLVEQREPSFDFTWRSML